MKPDLALSLSFEGIGLLARAAGGWRKAGMVSLDAAELALALSRLRQTAVDLSGPAFRTKLIIPNDQIRYLSVDTGHVSTADRINKVRAALDGATPYPVEALVYDICVDGPLTHVAAVARETLEEAESFALEHRFNPLSFVAIPGNEAFLSEPFFGPTSFSETALASGQRVEPDGVAVVIIGSLDDLPPEPQVAKLSSSQEPSAGVEVPSTQQTDVVAQSAEPIQPEQADPALPVQADPPPDAEDAPGEVVPGFSSRRAGVAPALGGATRSTISPRIDDDDNPTPNPTALAASLKADPAQIAEKPEAQTWAARFLSRRSSEPVADMPERTPEPEEHVTPKPAPPVGAAVPPAPAPIGAAEPKFKVPRKPAKPALSETDERERMTIFGMRDKDKVGGSPRHLGLILTTVLLLFLAGVAAWASVFLDDGVSSLFKRDEPVRAAQVPQEALPRPVAPEPAATQDLAALSTPEPGLTDTDAAVLDALREEPNAPAPPDETTAEARYAVTGIWQRAPEPPTEAGMVSLDDLYLTSIDGSVDARDAVALPRQDSFLTDQPLGQVISPAGAGSRFAFDENGRIIPTPEGALSPEGFTVVLGRPPVVPPPTPTRFEVTPNLDEATQALITLRPRLRPADLVEQTERSQLGGLTLSELSGVRPLVRPEIEKTEEESDETPTAQAVLASLTPRLRPANMAGLVEQANRDAPAATGGATQVASAAAVAAPAPTVVPNIPSSASVARAATIDNAINLRRVNLIGVYGTPSNRRALVRLPNGRYKKVQVGDRIDGGSISAISESELRYQKGGRNVTLKIPSG